MQHSGKFIVLSETTGGIFNLSLKKFDRKTGTLQEAIEVRNALTRLNPHHKFNVYRLVGVCRK